MQQVLRAQAFAVLICTTCLPSGAAKHKLVSTNIFRRTYVVFSRTIPDSAGLLCIQAWLNTDGRVWTLTSL